MSQAEQIANREGKGSESGSTSDGSEDEKEENKGDLGKDDQPSTRPQDSEHEDIDEEEMPPGFLLSDPMALHLCNFENGWSFINRCKPVKTSFTVDGFDAKGLLKEHSAQAASGTQAETEKMLCLWETDDYPPELRVMMSDLMEGVEFAAERFPGFFALALGFGLW